MSKTKPFVIACIVNSTFLAAGTAFVSATPRPIPKVLTTRIRADEARTVLGGLERIWPSGIPDSAREGALHSFHDHLGNRRAIFQKRTRGEKVVGMRLQAPGLRAQVSVGRKKAQLIMRQSSDQLPNWTFSIHRWQGSLPAQDLMYFDFAVVAKDRGAKMPMPKNVPVHMRKLEWGTNRVSLEKTPSRADLVKVAEMIKTADSNAHDAAKTLGLALEAAGIATSKLDQD